MAKRLVQIFCFTIVCLISQITSISVEKKSECAILWPIDPKNEKEFFTLDGFRKCSMCDETTKLFAGSDCSCCFAPTESSFNSKDIPTFKTGFYVSVTYGVLTTIIIVVVVIVIFRNRRNQSTNRVGTPVVEQNEHPEVASSKTIFIDNLGKNLEETVL